MKTIYIDHECHCHANPASGAEPIETGVFDGMCNAFIDGCIFVPSGRTWTRSDGVEFNGEMVTTFEDINELNKLQAVYEQAQTELEDMRNALNVLGVSE